MNLVLVGAAGLGVMMAARSGGGTLGLLALARIGAEGRAGLVFLVTAGAFGLALLLMAVSPFYALALLLRQQEAQPDERPNLSLADFIAPKGSGIPDYLGMFAVTAGIGADELATCTRWSFDSRRRSQRSAARSPTPIQR